VFGVELAEKFNGDMRSYLKHLTKKYPFLWGTKFNRGSNCYYLLVYRIK
jgi:hypothetical protein